MSRVGLLVLAAGGSMRMGRPKQLLPHAGKTLIRHAVETALASVCRPVVVVLGANRTEIQTELAGLAVRVAHNARWQEGMGSSIAVGMEALSDAEGAVDAVVIMLCDQPDVSSVALNRLVQMWREYPGSLVASEYGGSVGVPALFPRSTFPELMRLEGAGGAKALLQRYGDRVAAIPMPEALLDIDTPEDYQRLVT